MFKILPFFSKGKQSDIYEREQDLDDFCNSLLEEKPNILKEKTKHLELKL